MNHNEDLYAILSNSSLILYGEWMNAKHSIHYNNLTDIFIAFDLFDILEQKFYSRERFHNILDQTSIMTIAKIMHVTDGSLTKSSLINLIKQPSLYCSDGTLREGVVIRIDDELNQWLVDKVKIVRDDFIAGDEHWTKGIIKFNEVSKTI